MLIKPKSPRKNGNNALIRYPVPIDERIAYLELPRNLTTRDIKRIMDVMLSLVNDEPDKT